VSVQGDRSLGVVISALLLLGTGVFMLAGFCTPIASTVAAVYCLGIALSFVPRVASSLPDDRIVAIPVTIVAIAIALLGPGAFSLDAYLFGRREIEIPPSSRIPDS
jgi:uncharacterized membrane protein YphA (DoxX/SURF4 family)